MGLGGEGSAMVKGDEHGHSKVRLVCIPPYYRGAAFKDFVIQDVFMLRYEYEYE